MNSRERTWNQGDYSQCKNKNNISIEPRERIEADDAYDRMQVPIAGSPATEKHVAGIIHLLLMISSEQVELKMERRVLARPKKDFQVGSEDWNDVTLTGQRIRWINDSQSGSCIEVGQQNAVDELEEIIVERNTKEDLHCTLAMHTMYRSLLGQIS